MSKCQFLAIILLAITHLLSGFPTVYAQTTTSDKAAAIKVIESYAATLDKIKKQGISLTVEKEVVNENKNWPTNNPAGFVNGTQKMNSRTEASWDGIRCFTHVIYFGYSTPTNPEIKKEDGVESFNLFDGKRTIGWSYLTPGNRIGQGGVTIASPKRQSSIKHGRMPPIHQMLGHPAYDEQRLDQILLKADSLSLEKKDPANPEGIVIQAKTPNATYLVTFDPSHDYHYSHVEIQLLLHDAPVPGRSTLGTATKTIVLDSFKFKKFADLWMPIEFHYVSELVNLYDNVKPNPSQRNETNFRVTDLQLAPDFKARHTFDPTFLPEGAILRYDNGQQDTATFQDVIWKQGRFVPVSK